MQNIGVFFGIRAAEHDVSIISGLQILENADKAKYNVFPVYVSRKGEWFVGEPLKNVETYKHFDENMKGLTKVYLPPVPGMGGLYANAGGLFAKAKLIGPMDCAILADKPKSTISCSSFRKSGFAIAALNASDT